MKKTLQESFFNLTDEVAVVIGGTGMLGSAIAKGLAGAGAKVAIVGRHGERGAHGVQTIVKSGGKAGFFSADATSRASLHAARLEIEKKFGIATILVNAAGGNDPTVTATPDHPFESITLNDWQKHFEINVGGGILVPCQEFGAVMCLRGKGSIINLASVTAHIPVARLAAYSASKAVILNLTKYLAREWAPKGVRVNSITPGWIPAEYNRRLLINEDGTPGPRAEAIFRHTPMGRFGEPDELAGAAVFLASPYASGFVTGIDIPIDGGFLAQTI